MIVSDDHPHSCLDIRERGVCGVERHSRLWCRRNMKWNWNWTDGNDSSCSLWYFAACNSHIPSILVTLLSLWAWHVRSKSTRWWICRATVDQVVVPTHNLESAAFYWHKNSHMQQKKWMNSNLPWKLCARNRVDFLFSFILRVSDSLTLKLEKCISGKHWATEK